jgi:DNA polymerase III epsilon subunit-like protein
LTRSVAEKLDREHLKRKEKQGSTVYKKKRNELKKKRKQRERKSYIQEPNSYQSEIASSASLSEADELDIPINLIKLDGSESFIYFDLETTSLSRNSDITHIAAVHGSAINQSYVFPRHEISVDASKVTGITCHLATNKMYVQGKEVTYTTQYQALLIFIDFLKDIQNPVFVGHNICNFDMPVLTNRLKEFGLFSTFIEKTKGFVDTLKMVKRMFSKNEVDNYKQCTLVKHFYWNILQCT